MNFKIVAVGSTTALTIVVLVFFSLLASGALVTSTTLSASGVITTGNLGVYSDSACTQKITAIDWGNILPSSSLTKTLYIKNTGTTALTLGLTKTNWSPTTADGPVALTWNRENTVLAANQVTTATLTLSTSTSISGITTFSMNIVITGST